MNQAEINEMLKSHERWLETAGEGELDDLGGINLRRADLRWVDLRGADLSHSDFSSADLRSADLYNSDLSDSSLSGANLRCSNLRGSSLRGADLRGADLDWSCWPLWCGSLKAHVDDRIAIQLLYHTLSVVQHSPHVSDELKRTLLTPEILNIANRFHRVDECGRLTVYSDMQEARA